MTKEKTVKKEKKVSDKDKIKELEEKIKQLNSDNLRLLAEFENYRKRKEKEFQEAREKAVISFVEDILPSIDNFEMSLKMSDNKDMFIKGVELIHQNLIDIMKQKNIESFEPKVGENFDFKLHEPVLIEDESKEKGKVLGTLKKGYKHKEIVIRPARVQVVKEN